MFKAFMWIIVILVLAAYFTNPNSLKPWGKVWDHAGNLAAHVVQKTGEAADDLASQQLKK